MDIKIIGTSHIAQESIKKVKQIVSSAKPDIIAVELDAKRYYALTHKTKAKFSFYNIGRVGLKGFLFAMIGSWASKKMGKMVGVDPGEEMLTAIKLARKNKIQLALIDQDIEKTLYRFSKSLTWKERWHFVADIFNGLFFRKREIKKLGLGKLNLKKVPSDVMIRKLIGMMKKRYPNVYRVLVHERNVYMAARLKELMIKYPGSDIVAVVGAGHVEGIQELLSEPTVSFGYEFDAGETVGIEFLSI